MYHTYSRAIATSTGPVEAFSVYIIIIVYHTYSCAIASSTGLVEALTDQLSASEEIQLIASK